MSPRDLMPRLLGECINVTISVGYVLC
jgi:hypothetical protein